MKNLYQREADGHRQSGGCVDDWSSVDAVLLIVLNQHRYQPLLRRRVDRPVNHHHGRTFDAILPGRTYPGLLWWNNVKLVDFFVLRNISITRGHNLKLFKPRCNLNVRKYSFAYQIIDIWNSLTSDIINANSISVFKQKLESVDFTPFVRVYSSLRPVFHCCVIFFCWVCVSVFMTCLSRLLFLFE